MKTVYQQIINIHLLFPGNRRHHSDSGRIQVLLEANGLAAGKDHQFKGRYDAEKNAVIISLETDEQEK